MNTQVSYFKKALVVLMAVIMVFTYMPSMAWAESENAVQPVNIYVTLALDSDGETKEFAKAKDGTDMAMKSVTVSDVDNDGKLTAYDAISCMQTQYAPEGKDWAVDDKNVITKLWGDEAPFLVYKDNVIQMPSFNKNGLHIFM